MRTEQSVPSCLQPVSWHDGRGAGFPAPAHRPARKRRLCRGHAMRDAAGLTGRGRALQSRDGTIDWVARAHGLASVIAANADRTEGDRRIADDVIAAIDAADIPRMLLPASLGGAAADILTFNRVIEALAAADG